MTLPDNDIDLLEEAFRLITRYQETRDAALVDDAHVCEDWLARCFGRLAERRIAAEAQVDAPIDTDVSAEVSDEDWQEQIAIGVHTGLRKGSDAPSSGPLWRAIGESDDSAWNDAARFCVWGMKAQGYRLVKP
jgi:hypothetical protein